MSGGAEIHLHRIFGRLADRGHDVDLLCSGWKGAEPRVRLDGIDVHRVGRRYTFGLHARRYYRRHLAARDHDVIVEDLNKVPLFTPRWGSTPVVLLVHHLFGTTAFQEANPVLAAATWLLERPIPRVFREVPVIAVSDSTARDLESRGIETARIQVIPNGIDTERHTPLPPGASRYPEPTILYMGRAKRYKRVDLVLEALALLRDQGRSARLLVAGRGEHLDALQRLARELGLGEDRVRFLGFVSEEDKLDLLRRAWIHVFTSPKEGWGIANLEAAACGTPTVASDSPGLRDSVKHGETGLLVPHGDVEALAAALHGLLADPDRLEAMGRRARSFAEGFSWDESARRTEAILAGRVARRPAAD